MANCVQSEALGGKSWLGHMQEKDARNLQVKSNNEAIMTSLTASLYYILSQKKKKRDQRKDASVDCHVPAEVATAAPFTLQIAHLVT